MAYSKEKQSAWQKANPEKMLASAQRYRDKIRLEMVKEYGGKCCKCGITDSDLLVLDHIYDDAQIDRKQNNHTGGIHMYSFLRRNGWPKDKYQLLCHNCNYKKELERRKKERKANALQQIAK